MSRKIEFNTKVIGFIIIFLLSACNPSIDKTKHQITAEQDNAWKIGAKIHFEEESRRDYVGLKEINSITKDVLKSVLNIRKDSGNNNAKILLKKENGEVQIDHYVEKSRPNVGEEMHATLLYTSPRGFHDSETLAQICNALFSNCQTPPRIETVARTYGAIIKPSWRFKISEIEFTKSDNGPSFIMAKLLFNDRENIYLGAKPISAVLHMTLVNCVDSSILSDPQITVKLIKKLNDRFKGKLLKIADKNDTADLEFGMSGQSWRIRAGQKIAF